MRKVASPLLAAVGLLGVVLPAASVQQSATVVNFMRQALARQSQNIVAAAGEMPADKYGYTTGPDQMTFGQLVLHVADGNYLFCSRIGATDQPMLPKIDEKDAKANLVGRLKASFDFCNTSLASLDSANMAETLDFGDMKASRSMSILTLTSTWNQHYSMETTYLQLNGRTPPAAVK